MIKNENQSPELPNILRRHQDEIILQWKKKFQKISSISNLEFHLDDISSWMPQALDVMVGIIKSGITPTIEAHQQEATLTLLQKGFSINEITKGLLLSKTVILPIIRDACLQHPETSFDMITQLDDCLYQFIGHFEQLFSEAMHQQLIDDARKRLTESESLRRTMAALLQKLTLDEVLEIVCLEACRLTQTTGSAVFLLEDGWLRVMISTGTPLPILDRLPVDGSLAGLCMQQGTPMIANKPTGQIQAYHLNPELKSLLVVPLLIDEVSIGVLDVVNKEDGFNKDDVRVMGMFADQAAIAIDNARLHHQAEKLAVLEERQRLARDLHDSVTQSLYSASLYVNAAEKALSRGKMGVAAANLHELRSMTREAMLDMRLLIFELHPPILETEGLVVALKTRLESVEARSGIQTEFKVDGERRLPLPVEIELYRIAQEALTNVVKHAKAQQVRVHLVFDDEYFHIRVWDNGVGFDSKNFDQSGGRGLTGIRERAQKINGNLVVESTPGKGTSLEVWVKI